MSYKDFFLQLTINSRSFARKLGVIHILSGIRDIIHHTTGRSGYEVAFDETMQKEIQVGVASRNPRNFRNVELSGITELFSAVIS